MVRLVNTTSHRRIHRQHQFDQGTGIFYHYADGLHGGVPRDGGVKRPAIAFATVNMSQFHNIYEEVMFRSQQVLRPINCLISFNASVIPFAIR